MSFLRTQCTIKEPQPYHRECYSQKFNGGDLRNDIGVSIGWGDIHSITDIYPCGSYPDVCIFRYQIKERLKPEERFIADNWCADKLYLRQFHAVGFSLYHCGIFRRHKAINDHLKRFRVLTVPSRHKKTLHSYFAIANVTNLSITFDELLYNISRDLLLYMATLERIREGSGVRIRYSIGVFSFYDSFICCIYMWVVVTGLTM